MNIDVLELWLKNTIPGLILLGAIGSIVAVWVFKLFGTLLQIISVGRIKYKAWEYRKGWSTGIIAGHITFEKDSIVSSIWFSYKLARLTISSTIFLTALIILVILIEATTQNILTTATLITIIICFLLIRWIYEEYRDIRIYYRDFVLPIVKESEKRREEKLKD